VEVIASTTKSGRPALQRRGFEGRVVHANVLDTPTEHARQRRGDIVVRERLGPAELQRLTF